MIDAKHFQRPSKLLMGAMFIASLATPVNAAIIAVNSKVDLSKALLLNGAIEAGNYTGNAASLPLISPVNISAGDTFNFHISFANGQTLTVDDIDEVAALLITQGEGQSANVTMTGALDLFGVDGEVVASGEKTDTAGHVEVGQGFYANDLMAPASVTISGLDYTGFVVGYDSGYDTRTYDSPNLAIVGSKVTINSPATVPEPFTLSLFGAGLVGALATRRKPRTPA